MLTVKKENHSNVHYVVMGCLWVEENALTQKAAQSRL